MKSNLARLVALVFLSVAVNVGSAAEPRIAIPAGAEILARLKPGHPRLFASSNDFVRLRERVEAGGRLREWRDAIRREGEAVLTQAPSKYEIPDGLRLLSVSRRVLRRAQVLGLLYRLDGDGRWRDRLWRELEAAAGFKDWNPRHFLDTAEMTHALAVGYDWLYDAWTDAQRETLRTALVEKGLKVGLGVHQRTVPGSWPRARHNWNQVCNGGLGIGALAVAESEPELAGELLQDALVSIQLAMAEFAPDGAWAEGPGYWDYATTYNVALLAALETAVGTDFGLSGIPGFAEAGAFPLYLSGPLDRTFNYADGGDGPVRAPQLLWLARKFARPAYAAYQERMASPEPMDLLWFDGAVAADKEKDTLPLDRHFRGADIVSLRSAWKDRQAVFVGFKAGDNKANHSHLDLGTFVFDALGHRWAMDLGGDDYNLPAYFGKARWTYYRLRAEGQNTLVLNPGNGPDQSPTAAARLERFESTAGRALAIADLSAAYTAHARRVRRGLALLDRERLLVQDEIDADVPVDAWWFMHTPAEITIGAGGRVAMLRQGDDVVRAELLGPTPGPFEVQPAAPLPGAPHPERQNPNRGVRKLSIHLPAAREVRLAVLLTPARNGAAAKAAPAWKSLADW